MTKQCFDCDKDISKNATRCRSCAAIRRNSDPRWMARRERTMKPIRNSPEYKRNMSEKIKAVWNNPEYRGKQETARTSPEFRARMSEKMHDQWADPIERQELIDSQIRSVENGALDSIKDFFEGEYEFEIVNALESNGVHCKSQYRPDGCRWYYDIYLPDDEILVELDGAGHRQAIKQKRDVEKDSWAIDNNYKMIHISTDIIEEFGVEVTIEILLDIIHDVAYTRSKDTLVFVN